MAVTSFIDRIAELSGEEIFRCYQCQKCSTGCPFVEFMDVAPSNIIRLIQLDFKENVLNSKTIWICASCETCTTRCPNQVDIAMTMDALRQECIRQGHKPAVKDVHRFHSAFLDSVRSYGRVHELGMVGKYKMKSGRFFDDLKLGLDMFKKGKLKLSPHKIKGLKEIRKIFSESGNQKGE